MSLTAIRLLNGTATNDIARWDDIWLASHEMILECVDKPIQEGGYIHVGTSRNLMIST